MKLQFQFEYANDMTLTTSSACSCTGSSAHQGNLTCCAEAPNLQSCIPMAGRKGPKQHLQFLTPLLGTAPGTAPPLYRGDAKNLHENEFILPSSRQISVSSLFPPLLVHFRNPPEPEGTQFLERPSSNLSSHRLPACETDSRPIPGLQRSKGNGTPKNPYAGEVV